MYEVTEIQDYRQKWLEAERDLALNWIEPLSIPLYEPLDHIDKNIEPIDEPPSTSRKLEDYQPGATREEVLHFMEKVVTSPKPSRKREQSLAPISK